MSYQSYYPNGWQSGESGKTPITPEALQHMENGIKNSAPGGFGLGATWGNPIYDANQAVVNGVYACADPLNCENFVTAEAMQYGPLVVFARHQNIKQIQYFRSYKVVRFSEDSGNTWSPWEWENPPMRVGVEYRTTERWNDAPVYAKLVNIGKIAASMSVSTGINNARVVRASITWANMLANFHDFTTTTLAGWDFTAWTNLSEVRVKAGADAVASGGNVYAEFRYAYYTDEGAVA